jgi:hypothetical protein
VVDEEEDNDSLATLSVAETIVFAISLTPKL